MERPGRFPPGSALLLRPLSVLPRTAAAMWLRVAFIGIPPLRQGTAGGGKVKNGLLSTRFDRRALSGVTEIVMLMCYPPVRYKLVPLPRNCCCPGTNCPSPQGQFKFLAQNLLARCSGTTASSLSIADHLTCLGACSFMQRRGVFTAFV